MPDIACCLERSVTDQETVNQVWDAYYQAFAACERQCIQEQMCYSKESLADALSDPEYMKFVLRVDGQVAGFVLATDNLEKARVAYVNPERLAVLFPEDVSGKKLWYFTAFAIRPDSQSQRYSQHLFDAVMSEAMPKQAHLCFDFSIEKNGMLPKMLENGALRAFYRLPAIGEFPVEYKRIGGQEYGMLYFNYSTTKGS